MDTQLTTLIEAVKHAFNLLQPDKSPLSYILMIGKPGQGKTALLKQSKYKHITIDSDEHLCVYYNGQGVIVELSEKWINEREWLMQDTLKALNQAHRLTQISGIALCVDISPFLEIEPSSAKDIAFEHSKFLKRIADALPTPVPLSIIMTKMDNIAGFCDFFNNDHSSDLKKPLGFSLPSHEQSQKQSGVFNLRFEQFTEVLNQQVLQKLHHARSHIKRTLIREFPLKLMSLKPHLQVFLQTLPKKNLRLQAIYFTSAEQGGVSIDPLNKRISHEYALVLHDRYTQSNNFKPFFIEGALKAFQAQTKQYPSRMPQKIRTIIGSVALATGLGLSYVIHHHIHVQHLLDDASKDLLRYENLMQQGEKAPIAIFHLQQAQIKLEQAAKSHRARYIKDLSSQLKANTEESIQIHVLPHVLSIIEAKLESNTQSPSEKFETLKVYLMLCDEKHHNPDVIRQWFTQHWPHSGNLVQEAKTQAIFIGMLSAPLNPKSLNPQLITDVRNYLNTLPQGFILYTMAKDAFPKNEERLSIPGFTLVHQTLPYMYTKEGYASISQKMPQIAQQLEMYDWVLERPTGNQNNMSALLQEAYAVDYTTWWQNLMATSFPTHYQTYQQGSQTVKALSESQSMRQFLNLIQQQTGPILDSSNSRFNQDIASQFTDINLISKTIQNDLQIEMAELERFLTTLSVVNDGGRTAFNITKARFQGTNQSDPLSTLYARAQKLPAPLSKWTQQLADEATTLLINEARGYINLEWQKTVYAPFDKKIKSRFPFDEEQPLEVSIDDFNQFFSPEGDLNQFTNEYIKPFMNISSAQWSPKSINGFMMPIQKETIDELIRANVITTMFFPDQTPKTEVGFSLQKLNLDPIINHLELRLGQEKLIDSQRSESVTDFSWPQSKAELTLLSIEGNRYQMKEEGPWAIFRLLQKMNVVVDENDSSSLEVVFDIKGYTGHYLLRAQNQINPFIPGILSGFGLPEAIV